MPLSKICMSNILGYLYADPKIGMVQPNASKSVQVALAPLKNGEKRKNFELQVIIFVNYTMKNIVCWILKKLSHISQHASVNIICHDQTVLFHLVIVSV